uniref:Uncharacterized protein n=1 Tax=Rousettus aegyptiacus TaxID=9407 RepID=A0A7J8CI83_ROUAE|nr:hypothetical protein HJG63_009069 [Rousettus aegyptiacus]
MLCEESWACWNVSSWESASPFIFICFPHTHRLKDTEMLKRPLSPIHCHRRESTTLSSCMKNKLSLSFLSSCPLPSHRYPQIPTAMRIRAVLLPATPTQQGTLLPLIDQSLLSSLINASRSPPANFWPHLRITWNTSLKQ